MFGHSLLRCYGHWMQEGFVGMPQSLRRFRKFFKRFCQSPLTWIQFQKFGKWQSSTRKNALPQLRCSSSAIMDKDSALHGTRFHLAPPGLLRSLSTELPPQILPSEQIRLYKQEHIRTFLYPLRTSERQRVPLFKQYLEHLTLKT